MKWIKILRGKTMTIYRFTRIIRKREAINQYGKLGYRYHREAVFIEAASLEDAKIKMIPYNYKKHFKFISDGTFMPIDEKTLNSVSEKLGEIIDLGVIDNDSR